MKDECHVGRPIETTPEQRHYGDLHANVFWDKFYKRNSTNFYKDRHYLHKVFPGIGKFIFVQRLLLHGQLARVFPCEWCAPERHKRNTR